MKYGHLNVKHLVLSLLLRDAFQHCVRVIKLSTQRGYTVIYTVKLRGIPHCHCVCFTDILHIFQFT